MCPLFGGVDMLVGRRGERTAVVDVCVATHMRGLVAA